MRATNQTIAKMYHNAYSDLSKKHAAEPTARPRNLKKQAYAEVAEKVSLRRHTVQQIVLKVGGYTEKSHVEKVTDWVLKARSSHFLAGTRVSDKKGVQLSGPTPAQEARILRQQVVINWFLDIREAIDDARRHIQAVRDPNKKTPAYYELIYTPQQRQAAVNLDGERCEIWTRAKTFEVRTF